jgi:Fe-S cluster biogenesis protein NfuA
MIAIRGEPQQANPELCRFVVEEHLLLAGRSHLCPDAASARGAPLLEALFAIPGVTQALVSGDTVTLQKSGAPTWQEIGPQVGRVLRAHLESGAKFAPPAPPTASLTPAGASELASRVRHLLETQVNPGVASHGGKIELVEIRGSSAILKMSGGCQGCGSAKATLKLGVEKALRAQIPEITEVIDVTDHSAGRNPYFAAT